MRLPGVIRLPGNQGRLDGKIAVLKRVSKTSAETSSGEHSGKSPC